MIKRHSRIINEAKSYINGNEFLKKEACEHISNLIKAYEELEDIGRYEQKKREIEELKQLKSSDLTLNVPKPSEQTELLHQVQKQLFESAGIVSYLLLEEEKWKK